MTRTWLELTKGARPKGWPAQWVYPALESWPPGWPRHEHKSEAVLILRNLGEYPEDWLLVCMDKHGEVDDSLAGEIIEIRTNGCRIKADAGDPAWYMGLLVRLGPIMVQGGPSCGARFSVVLDPKTIDRQPVLVAGLYGYEKGPWTQAPVETWE